MEFAGRIKEARRDAGLNQTELAARVGVSQRAVQMWESGDRTPRAKFMRKLSEVTGKPIAWFYSTEVAA